MFSLILIAHNIRSLHNVGSIFRTADAADVEKIYLTGYTPAPVDRLGNPRSQIAKVSLGAEETVAWERNASLARVIAKLRKEGYLIAAVEQGKGSVPYDQFRSRKKKIALILGNEVRGLAPSVLRSADAVLEIPMHGKKESLNVSVAAGIVLFELRKRGIQ